MEKKPDPKLIAHKLFRSLILTRNQGAQLRIVNQEVARHGLKYGPATEASIRKHLTGLMSKLAKRNQN